MVCGIAVVHQIAKLHNGKCTLRVHLESMGVLMGWFGRVLPLVLVYVNLGRSCAKQTHEDKKFPIHIYNFTQWL